MFVLNYRDEISGRNIGGYKRITNSAHHRAATVKSVPIETNNDLIASLYCGFFLECHRAAPFRKQ